MVTNQFQATSSIRESLLQQLQSADDFNLTNCMRGVVHALNCMKFDDVSDSYIYFSRT